MKREEDRDQNLKTETGIALKERVAGSLLDISNTHASHRINEELRINV